MNSNLIIFLIEFFSIIYTFDNTIYVSTTTSEKTDQIRAVSNLWTERHQNFDNDFDALVVDEIDNVTIIFKKNKFSVLFYSQSEPKWITQELDTYFPGLVKVDASELIIDEKEPCWDQFRCRILHLFQGHQWWSFNWYHFWHIESHKQNPIDLRLIDPELYNLKAAFAHINTVSIVNDNSTNDLELNSLESKTFNQFIVSDMNIGFQPSVRPEFNTTVNRTEVKTSSPEILNFSRISNVSEEYQLITESNIQTTSLSLNQTEVKTNFPEVSDVSEEYQLITESKIETTSLLSVNQLEINVNFVDNSADDLEFIPFETNLNKTITSERNTSFKPSVQTDFNEIVDKMKVKNNFMEGFNISDEYLLISASNIQKSSLLSLNSTKTNGLNISYDYSSITGSTINMTSIPTTSLFSEDNPEFDRKSAQVFDGMTLKNVSYSESDKEQRFMSMTKLWITTAIVMIIAIIIGLWFWTNLDKRKGYYSLNQTND